jgi:hypothetical protein
MAAEGKPEANKRWVAKSPAQVVLEQIAKQEKKVQGLEDQLKKEKTELQKLQQAKKIFEAAS